MRTFTFFCKTCGTRTGCFDRADKRELEIRCEGCLRESCALPTDFGSDGTRQDDNPDNCPVCRPLRNHEFNNHNLKPSFVSAKKLPAREEKEGELICPATRGDAIYFF